MTRLHLKFGIAIVFAVAACHSDSPVQPLAVCTVASAQTFTLAVGEYRTIDPATNSGCFGFPANASATDSAEYLVMPWSTAAKPEDSTNFILTAPGRQPTARVVTDLRPTPRRSIAREFDAFRLRAERTGNYGRAAQRSVAAAAAPAGPTPGTCNPTTQGQLCAFIVCDTVTCQTTQQVGARLVKLGTQVAIFVDTLAPDSAAGGLWSVDYDTLQTTFDTRLYPLNVATFGAVSDFDANGHVIVLMTPVVNALVSVQECNTLGFILGFFFGGDLDPRVRFNFNRGEIYYSLAADAAGKFSCPHDRTSVKRLSPRTFAHEFQHMINFAQHAVIHTTTVPVSEEGWLDEGLSTYAEEVAAHTYIDPAYPNNPLPDTVRYRRFLVFGDMFDAYSYMQDPPSNYLEIPQDQGSVGEIGASWLFVRYLMDHYGPGLAAKLVQTTLYGSANIAVQTGQDFPTLVSRWALANYVSDMPGFPTAPELKYTSWQFRTVFDTLRTSVRQPPFSDSTDFDPIWPLAPTPLSASTFFLNGTLRSGTGYYMTAVQKPLDPAFSLLFSSPTFTALPARSGPRLIILRLR